MDLPESCLRDVRGKDIGHVFHEPTTSLNLADLAAHRQDRVMIAMAVATSHACSSSSRICRPPGPVMMSLRKLIHQIYLMQHLGGRCHAQEQREVRVRRDHRAIAGPSGPIVSVVAGFVRDRDDVRDGPEGRPAYS